jgi:hypothetical protein
MYLDESKKCNCEDPSKTLCTGDTSKNIWYQGGKCKLDQLTYSTVIYILSRNRNAKADLLRITSDPCLIQIANRTGLVVPTIEDSARVEARLNNPAQTLPFYTLFRGNLNRKF